MKEMSAGEMIQEISQQNKLKAYTSVVEYIWAFTKQKEWQETKSKSWETNYVDSHGML